jgi:tyrosine decarboxylase / aspartate 1-decarboxylase
MPKDLVPRLLSQATEALEAEFGALPDFEAAWTGVSEAVASVLAETAHRLGDNYPYFHPLYAGQMLKPPHPVARAAYALAMNINPNNHALDGGRASSAMEVEAVREIAGMFGWTTYLGHLTSSGTIANLEALWMAGQLAAERGTKGLGTKGLGTKGLGGRGKRIAGSEQAHYTHQRISAVLRLEYATIPTDERGRMRVDALEDEVRKGDVGTIVATLGTTALGAVDPLDEILVIARKYDCRVHVDGAYGGYFGLIADELDEPTRRAYAAAGQADSIVIDPHKHGLQPYGCGCVLFRDPGVGRFYKHDSPYTYFTSKDLHLGEISLECSRAGAAAVALWATMRLLPLKAGGEFARGLAKGRGAAVELARRLRGDARFVGLGGSAPGSPHAGDPGHANLLGHTPLRQPELDIVVWGLHGADSRTASERAQRVFDACAKRGLHLALVQLPGSWFGQGWRGKTVTCLRSVLMKPEHEMWIGRIWEILSEACDETK